MATAQIATARGSVDRSGGARASGLQMGSTTTPATTIGSRLALRGAQLENDGGVLVARLGGQRVRLGRMPTAAGASTPDHLTITSTTLAITGCLLVAQCYGPCRSTHPVIEMGLRHMGDGSVRNQPRCAACRHSSKRTSTKRRRTGLDAIAAFAGASRATESLPADQRDATRVVATAPVLRAIAR